MRKIIFSLLLIVFTLIPFACIASEETEKEECKIAKQLTGLTVISDNKAQMIFSSAISSTYSDSFWHDIFILENKTKIRDIDVYMYCLGGDMFAGFAIIEHIEKAKKNGFIFTAYASGAIGSMAIPIYATFNHRIGYPSTVFMVHPTSLGTAKMMLTGADLQSQTELYNMTQDQYVSAIAKYSTLSKEEWLEKIQKDTWFSAEQAKEWGLVDEVR